MSTFWTSRIEPTIDEILNLVDMSDGKIREDINEQTRTNHRCFTDGENYVWLSIHDGKVNTIERYGQNDESFMIDLIENKLGYKLYHENEDEYWEIRNDN